MKEKLRRIRINKNNIGKNMKEKWWSDMPLICVSMRYLYIIVIHRITCVTTQLLNIFSTKISVEFLLK
jgi:hypothetical protein